MLIISQTDANHTDSHIPHKTHTQKKEKQKDYLDSFSKKLIAKLRPIRWKVRHSVRHERVPEFK